MPKRDADLLVEDMRAAIGRMQRYMAGLNRETFLQDEKTIDAVVRNLEILGEAARQEPRSGQFQGKNGFHCRGGLWRCEKIGIGRFPSLHHRKEGWPSDQKLLRSLR